MKWKTYDDWKSDGFQVLKGSKAARWNNEGTGLFSEKQVDRVQHKYSGWNADPMEYLYNEEEDPFGDPYLFT